MCVRKKIIIRQTNNIKTQFLHECSTRPTIHAILLAWRKKKRKNKKTIETNTHTKMEHNDTNRKKSDSGNSITHKLLFFKQKNKEKKNNSNSIKWYFYGFQQTQTLAMTLSSELFAPSTQRNIGTWLKQKKMSPNVDESVKCTSTHEQIDRIPSSSSHAVSKSKIEAFVFEAHRKNELFFFLAETALFRAMDRAVIKKIQ